MTLPRERPRRRRMPAAHDRRPPRDLRSPRRRSPRPATESGHPVRPSSAVAGVSRAHPLDGGLLGSTYGRRKVALGRALITGGFAIIALACALAGAALLSARWMAR